ncbi:MAG: hypothetical protein CFE31_08745 [Rhizobiales bacterium PAR1]|nr:MAG: hypothetical protein CFE31_08745 [Rhizobiales bacterium PAR1]
MTPEPEIWNGFTRAALDIAYNNTAACPHAAETLSALASRSDITRARFCTARDVAYGTKERQRFDLLSCGKANAPLFVFIHGGYWQRNHKDMFSAMADGPMAQGFDAALIGYTLAPEATLKAIIAECEAAIRAILAEMGPRRLIVSGWSAGGHLAARLVEMPEVDAALAISGIFDLEPIRLGELNDKVRLTVEESIVESPLHRLDQATKPVILAYGMGELPELQRQSRDYFLAREKLGLPGSLLPLADKDHFTILAELAEPEGALASALPGILVFDASVERQSPILPQ